MRQIKSDSSFRESPLFAGRLQEHSGILGFKRLESWSHPRPGPWEARQLQRDGRWNLQVFLASLWRSFLSRAIDDEVQLPERAVRAQAPFPALHFNLDAKASIDHTGRHRQT